MNTPTIVYLVKATPHGNGFIKYNDAKDRQFQAAYRELFRDLENSGIRPVFGILSDIQSDGTFGRIYMLSEEVPENGALILEPATDTEPVLPKVVVNKIKDTLYDSPLYDVLVKQGVAVLNPREVGKYGDKVFANARLKEFLPASATLDGTTPEEREQQLSQFLRDNHVAVLKPHRGNGGKGVIKIDSDDDPQFGEVIGSEESYLMQAYIETNTGVKGFVSGRHDVRLYVIGGTVIASSVRQPKEGSWLSNTSQGGAIQFYTLQETPDDLLTFAKQVLSHISLPQLTYVSLDFFYGNGRWYLVEVNDQPGTTANYQHEAVATSIRQALVVIFKEAVS